MTIYITTIRSYTFTARIIHFGMWLWAVLRLKKVQKCRNHAEIVHGDLTTGAIETGVKTRDWLTYLNERPKIAFMYAVEVPEDRKHIIEAWLTDIENTPYEFENFWWHLVKIITGRWYGSKTTKKTYCYEVALRLVQLLGYEVDIFANPYEARYVLDKLFGEPIKVNSKYNNI